jgi:uncharacterized protein YecT (DUF1311 family)
MKRVTTGLLLMVAVCLLWTQVEARRRQSQAEMNQQAARDFQKADKELNRVYAKLNKALEPSKQKRLVAAQRAWIKFRDAESDFWASQMEGGSAEPMLNMGHKAHMTEQRTKELKEAHKALVEQR